MKYRLTMADNTSLDDVVFESSVVINGGDIVHLNGLLYYICSGEKDVLADIDTAWFAVYKVEKEMVQ